MIHIYILHMFMIRQLTGSALMRTMPGMHQSAAAPQVYATDCSLAQGTGLWMLEASRKAGALKVSRPRQALGAPSLPLQEVAVPTRTAPSPQCRLRPPPVPPPHTALNPFRPALLLPHCCPTSLPAALMAWPVSLPAAGGPPWPRLAHPAALMR
jgi:hypothetical protein